MAAFRAFVHRTEDDGWIKVEPMVPPAPDLLCEHMQRGHVAFELVSITDPIIAKVDAGYAPVSVSTFTTSDPSERIIRKKLHRSYEMSHPIELLIYTDGLVITPDDTIIATILPWIGSVEHAFRRVWFMGEHHVASIWSAANKAIQST